MAQSYEDAGFCLDNGGKHRSRIQIDRRVRHMKLCRVMSLDSDSVVGSLAL